MRALIALPDVWVDREPQEIATALLSALIRMLQLESVYIRFEARDGEPVVEAWTPAGPSAPAPLLHVLVVDHATEPGIATWNIAGGAAGGPKVVGLRFELPWENGLVLTSTNRPNFPGPAEAQLLRVAVHQAAIAIHAARRLSSERKARRQAESLLSRHGEILSSLVDELAPSLRSLSRRVHEVSRQIPPVDLPRASRTRDRAAVESTNNEAETPTPSHAEPSVSRRELQVLGLIARGLSNKEIAGVMWLSDRTVERHITSLYRKIGVARRSEATVFALRHGVV